MSAAKCARCCAIDVPEIKLQHINLLMMGDEDTGFIVLYSTLTGCVPNSGGVFSEKKRFRPSSSKFILDRMFIVSA